MTAIIETIAAKHNLHRSGSRWAGCCPKCGGSKDSDRFQIWDDGGFKCFACDFKGDLITWLREMEGKSCPEAHEAAEMECRVGASCKAWGTCRFGDGSGKKVAVKKPCSVSVPPAAPKEALPSAKTAKAASAEWNAWAEKLVASAEQALPAQAGIITWLAKRGISAEAAARFRLGWLAGQMKMSRAAIGLDPVRNGKTELWVPAGLVIPSHICGQVRRVKVRRPAWSREKSLPDLKYLLLEGSDTRPSIIEPLSGRVSGAVIVEAELDAMACAAACHDVVAVALGTVRNGIPDELLARLASAPVILVALDADGPGAAAIKAWKAAFRQARYWPVPAGKDPGDFVKEYGGDLGAWLAAGLPPVACQDERFSGRVTPDGERGKEECKEKTEQPIHYVVTIADGREIHVVKERVDWERLVAAGELVFSENELERLYAVVARMNEQERASAVDAVLAAKEVMAGAYVRAGRKEKNTVEV